MNGLGDPDAASVKYPSSYPNTRFPTDFAQFTDDAASKSPNVR